MKRVLNYPGSKWGAAERIISLFPPHKSYLEPFAGSLAVFFNKPLDILETINDLDGRLVNLFRVMRDRPAELARLADMTLYSREEYELSRQYSPDSLEDARRTLVKFWFAVGGKSDAGFKRNIKWSGGYNTQNWNNIPRRVVVAANRLKNAQIESRDAVQLIREMNDPDTLIYADPPYLNETITSRSFYKHIMTDLQHLDLLNALKAHTGPVILSGYNSELYNKVLHDWKKIEFQSYTGTVGANKRKIATECLWMNFEPFEQIDIFKS